MEKYRKTLKTRMTLLMFPALLAAVLGIYDTFFATEAIKENYIFSFQCGMTIGMGIMSVFLIIRLRSIISDDKKLRQQYNKENDERLNVIRAKAGMPMLMITSVGMLFAAILIGYSNQTVFITLIIAAVCQMSIGTIIKLIYLRKM